MQALQIAELESMRGPIGCPGRQAVLFQWLPSIYASLCGRTRAPQQYYAAVVWSQQYVLQILPSTDERRAALQALWQPLRRGGSEGVRCECETRLEV